MLIDADTVAMEEGLYVIELLLDMSRAYERVNWRLMRAELLKTQIPLCIINLIMDFIKSRRA